MNTIRFTSKALLLTLVAGLGFQASANPTFAAVRAAASTVAQKAAEFAKPAVTFVASKLPKATFTSGTVAGGVAGAAAGSVATKALTKTTEVAVQEAPKAVSTFGLSSLGKYGLAAAAVAGTAVVGYGLYKLAHKLLTARNAKIAANCPTCPTATKAPVVLAAAKDAKGCFPGDVVINGQPISHFEKVGDNEYRPVVRGQAKVKKTRKGQQPRFVCPDQLPANAKIVA